MAQRWESGAGRSPHICTAQPGHPHPKHTGSRGEERPLNSCLAFEAYCTARKCRRKHSASLLWAFSAVLSDFRPCSALPSLWPAGAGPAISGVRVTFHLLSTFLLQELDRVALEFTLTRLSWPPSAALGLAIHGTDLGRHRRSLAAFGGVPSLAATCSARPPSAALGLHRRRLDAICGTRQCSAASDGPRRLASTTGSLCRAFRIVGQP
jgi:hypothetical protein